MNDLSNQPAQQTPHEQNPSMVSGAVFSGNKEVVGGGIDRQDGFRDATVELPVSKEVLSSGVRVHPTVIPIPPNVSKMGVKPAGDNISSGMKCCTASEPHNRQEHQ